MMLQKKQISRESHGQVRNKIIRRVPDHENAGIVQNFWFWKRITMDGRLPLDKIFGSLFVQFREFYKILVHKEDLSSLQ